MELNNIIKKGRVTITSGDVFEVTLPNDGKGYIQFLYKDDSFLAGHLVRGFSVLDIEQSDINENVLFYGYTRIFEGIKEGFWSKIGNVEIEPYFEPPTFKITIDTKAYVSKSKNWYVWKGDFNKAFKIGEMTDEYKNLPFSAIVSPETIIEWLKNRKADFSYLPD
jgi:hypothetical protein